MGTNPTVFRTPEWTLTDAEVKILAALFLAMKKGERPSKLKVATGLSEPTLHKYLDMLMKKKLISREVVISVKYPTPVIYKLAEGEAPLNFAKSSFEWVHRVEWDFNELQYAKHVMRVALSKLLNKNIYEVSGNSTYELAEELRQYIAQVLKDRNPAQLTEEDKEFIQMADVQKEHMMQKGFYGTGDFFTGGTYPKDSKLLPKRILKKK